LLVACPISSMYCSVVLSAAMNTETERK